MKIIEDSIWNKIDDLDYICITTNSILNSKKELVMGAGIAKEAKNRYPSLPKEFGKKILEKGYEGKFYGIIVYAKFLAFQTKIHYKDNSPLDLVKKSCEYLKIAADLNKNLIFGLPFPAVTNGGRTYEEILPIVSILPDNVYIFKTI